MSGVNSNTDMLSEFTNNHSIPPKAPSSRGKNSRHEKTRKASNLTQASQGAGDTQSQLADGSGLVTASFKLGEIDQKNEMMRSRTAGMASSNVIHSKINYLTTEEL